MYEVIKGVAIVAVIIAVLLVIGLWSNFCLQHPEHATEPTFILELVLIGLAMFGAGLAILHQEIL